MVGVLSLRLVGRTILEGVTGLVSGSGVTSSLSDEQLDDRDIASGWILMFGWALGAEVRQDNEFWEARDWVDSGLRYRDPEGEGEEGLDSEDGLMLPIESY